MLVQAQLISLDLATKIKTVIPSFDFMIDNLFVNN